MNEILHQALLTQQILTKSKLIQATQQANKHQQPLIDYLIEHQHADEQSIANAIAKTLQYPYKPFIDIDIESYLIQSNPFSEWLSKNILVIEKNDHIQFIIADPKQLKNIENKTGYKNNKQQQIIIAPYQQLIYLINNINTQRYYQLIKKNDNQKNPYNMIELVEHILADAVQHCASDIHIEPQIKQINLRMRIDGLLYLITEFPINNLAALTSRLKIMANLDIAEKRLPQDGRFSYSAQPWMQHDIRVNTCPTLLGEKIVLRLLNGKKNQITINQLGLEKSQQQQLLQQLKKPQGLIIITGPTGSGKTMTAYAALQTVNQISKNIMSIEDPVEIQLAGVNQVNVNYKTGLSFAVALRAFLRQDPDIILVGEIRDQETAEMAMRAGQTGHLVLSTMHTNSAVESLQRLLYMGVAPYHIANSTSMIIAQRLLRRLCQFCQGNSCRHCQQGYHGRTAVFELMPIQQNIAEAILQKKTKHVITELAKQNGMTTLWQAATNKVKKNITDLNECYRVLNKEA